jgi:hypothetical protein
MGFFCRACRGADETAFSFLKVRWPSAIEKAARHVIGQIPGPRGQCPWFVCQPPNQTQRIGKSLEQGTEQLRRVTKTFPVALPAGIGRRRIQLVPVQIPQAAEILISPIAARVGMSIGGIDEEEIDTAAATVGRLF